MWDAAAQGQAVARQTHGIPERSPDGGPLHTSAQTTGLFVHGCCSACHPHTAGYTEPDSMSREGGREGGGRGRQLPSTASGDMVQQQQSSSRHALPR